MEQALFDRLYVIEIDCGCALQAFGYPTRTSLGAPRIVEVIGSESAPRRSGMRLRILRVV
jgi:hypothetical protein